MESLLQTFLHVIAFVYTLLSLAVQVYRLLNQVDLALADLDQAILLSSGHGKVAEQAYTQRGLIRRLRGDDEGALADFKCAANLGSRYARKQVHICCSVVYTGNGEGLLSHGLL